MSSTVISPNWREVISAQSTITGQQEYLTSTSQRLNVNAFISGTTGTASILVPTPPTPSAQTDQNALITAPTGVGTGTITLDAGNTASEWYDLLNYPWISVEILTNTGPSTLTWQTSGDESHTNVSNMGLGLAGNTVNSMANTTTSAVGNFYGPRTGRYFRVSSNVSGGNSVTLVFTFYTSVAYPTTTGVQSGQSGIWQMESRQTSTAPTVTAVASSASATVIQTSNNSRRGLTVFNDADKALYLKMGASPSTSSFTVKIAAGGYWEMPQLPTYTGTINGLWETGPTGNALVTEILA